MILSVCVSVFIFVLCLCKLCVRVCVCTLCIVCVCVCVCLYCVCVTYCPGCHKQNQLFEKQSRHQQPMCLHKGEGVEELLHTPHLKYTRFITCVCSEKKNKVLETDPSIEDCCFYHFPPPSRSSQTKLRLPPELLHSSSDHQHHFHSMFRIDL